MQPHWTPSPSRSRSSLLHAFLTRSGALTYAELHRWSIEEPAAFWRSLWEFADVVGSPGTRTLADGDRMPGARWFPEARLNFAENLLRYRGNGDAIVFRGENGSARRLTHEGLRREVASAAAAFREAGVEPGDRVAAWMPNLPETVIAMLAAASIGAIFSSCSPDFGVEGVIDRFGQIEPKILIAADGYFYDGKTFDCLERLREITQRLPSLRQVFVVPYTRETGGSLWPASDEELRFERLPFHHPLYILFSSGTTGVPKCIVHGAGGTLLQHIKEHQLHGDVHEADRLFYFTTCGWMMWNWLVSGLASGAAIYLYDGAPFRDSGRVLFDYAESERFTHFGTSAKFLDALAKTGLRPAAHWPLADLRTIFSTGSPLAPEGFDFVYRDIKSDVQLASISGGTDIVSCFVLGCPLLPVYRGEIQCKGLGMAVDVFNEAGEPLVSGKGDLVCTRPFPSMPVGFWNDPDGAAYHKAYFARFPGVWCHGDYAEFTANGGIVIHGRSDATLNPGGVRIGTAEIYRQVEQIPEVLESLAVGQDWQNDVRVILFVRLRPGVTLDSPLEDRIRKTIRANTTPRHVPARILAVSDIPRTKSGKIVELAVREVIHGRPVKNGEALANPESLEQFREMGELAE